MVNEAGFIWKTSIEMNGKANGELSPVSKMVYLQKKKRNYLSSVVTVCTLMSLQFN